MRLRLLTWSLLFVSSIPSIAELVAADATATTQFTEFLIADKLGYPFGIVAVDMDGDGDLDMTCADATPSNCLYWFENDGVGKFIRHYIQRNEPERLERHAVGDINGDGRSDVVIVENLKGHLLWFEHPENPRADGLWPRHVITLGGMPGAYDVALLDVDGDGDLDVAASGWEIGNQFAWFENTGRFDGEWPKHLIEDNLKETRAVRAVDFDGDGDTDLFAVASGAGEVIWYENTGHAASRWKKHLINQMTRPMHGQPIDLDGDGDLDIVIACGQNIPLETPDSHRVVWLENPGLGSAAPWRQHLIDANFPDGFEAVASDLDGDGDLDVVASSHRRPGSVVWFENSGDPRGAWRKHVLKTDWRSANQVIVADFNGDKRPDIAAVAERGSREFRWWRNEGPANKVSAAISLDNRLEPFVDDYLIERLEGAQLQRHQPTPREVAIVHDLPWEGNVCCYHTVFRDGDIFRMYYRGSHYDARKNVEAHPEVLCYAESRDGIHWEKPTLGLIEFDGNKDNNIVWSGVGAHCFAPFKDANPACSADAQYKAISAAEGGLITFQSTDGLHWSRWSEKPVITKGAFDSQNLAFWDQVRGEYVEFHRGFREGVRDILTSTSPDFVNWTEPVWLEYPGAPVEHLYTNQITPYPRAPHIFLGFPMRFIESRKGSPGARFGGISDGVLMSSRDGKNFHRWPEAIIRPGPQPDRWVSRNNMTAWGMLETKSDQPAAPPELSIYSTEGYYQGDADRLRRFTWRLDGMASITAPLEGGEMLTKPLMVRSSQGGTTNLRLNFSTSAAGSLRCEIQHETGEPIEGYKLAECDEIFGDHVDRVVAWRGNADLSSLVGKPIRLRFLISDADLYSLRFQ